MQLIPQLNRQSRELWSRTQSQEAHHGDALFAERGIRATQALKWVVFHARSLRLTPACRQMGAVTRPDSINE